MGEAHLQLSAAVGVESRGRPRYQPGNFFESISEPAETRRSGALLGVAVPDRAQRSVFVAAASQAGERTLRAASARFRRAAVAGRAFAGGPEGRPRAV